MSVKQHNVANLLVVETLSQTTTTPKRAYGKRSAQEITQTTVTVKTSRNTTAYADAVRHFGWRVFACNDLELNLTEAVLAYRDEYIIERGFGRLRGRMLGITPLFLNSTTRIKGLIRLLSIALRVLCLVEFNVRKALQEEGTKLDGIYKGNPKRATAKPTTEMMLCAFRGLYLNVIEANNVNVCCVTTLSGVQERILTLLDFPLSIYRGIETQFAELTVKMGEP